MAERYNKEILSFSRQRLTRGIRVALGAAVVACLVVPVASAQATVRYAAPNGVPQNAPCTSHASPCDTITALEAENLEPGDTVMLAPGTYLPHFSSMDLSESITVEGEPGAPPPLLQETSATGVMISGPATLRSVRIEANGLVKYGVFLRNPEGSVERVESTGEAFIACNVIAGELKNSLCIGTGAREALEGRGVSSEQFIYATPSIQEFAITNVTAVGSEYGLALLSGLGSSTIAHVVNTAAVGGAAGVFAGLGSLPGDMESVPEDIDVQLSHSNFSDVVTESGEVHVSSPTENGNQSASPLFVDPAAGNYEEQAGSPTRLAGDGAVVEPGELDLAGNSRAITCEGTPRVDIGAYQAPAECPPPSGSGSGDTGSSGGGSTTTTPPPAPAPAPVAPTLTKLAFKPSKFEKKTTISFTLSAAATVKLEVLQKKQKDGKTKTIVVGALPQVSGKSGSNKVNFGGRLKGKALAAGKYTLRATATAAGLSSKALTAGFEILR